MNKSITRTMRYGAAALALCMAAGGTFAQDRRGPGPVERGPQGSHAQDHRGDRYDHRGDRYDRRGGPGYRGERQDYRQGREMDRRGFPHPRAEWRKGGRVPTEFRGRNYVVNDWRSHRLQAPPRGQQWVSVGGDYVLAAVATGIIMQIIAGQ